MPLMMVGSLRGCKMNTLQSFYTNGKSIIGFLILVLIFNMIFDQKTTEKFVLLVLFSMCILNADKFIAFMQKTFGGSGESEENNTIISDSRTTEEYLEHRQYYGRDTYIG